MPGGNATSCQEACSLTTGCRSAHLSHNAKTQYHKFETNIPRKGTAWPQSQFPHSFVCERFMYIFPQSVCLFCCRKICGRILGIYNLLTDTSMWRLGRRPRNSFSGNTQMGFLVQCMGNLLYSGVPIWLWHKPYVFITRKGTVSSDGLGFFDINRWSRPKVAADFWIF